MHTYVNTYTHYDIRYLGILSQIPIMIHITTTNAYSLSYRSAYFVYPLLARHRRN